MTEEIRESEGYKDRVERRDVGKLGSRGKRIQHTKKEI